MLNTFTQICSLITLFKNKTIHATMDSILNQVKVVKIINESLPITLFNSLHTIIKTNDGKQ